MRVLACPRKIGVIQDVAVLPDKEQVQDLRILGRFLQEAAKRGLAPGGREQSYPNRRFERLHEGKTLPVEEVLCPPLLAVKVPIGRNTNKDEEQEHHGHEGERGEVHSLRSEF